MTPGTTKVETVNNLVVEAGINASVTSLPLSHLNVTAEKTANDLMAEAEATINPPQNQNSPTT